MSGLKRKPQGGGGTSNLPDISGFPTSVAGNVIYDFGMDSEGFYKIPFFDSEENIWKQIAFKDFANSLKGGLNIRYFNDSTGADNEGDMTDIFLVIGQNFPNDRIIFPVQYFEIPKIINIANFCNVTNEINIGYDDENDDFVNVITSRNVRENGVQAFIFMGGIDNVLPLSSSISTPHSFFSDGKYLIQSANIKTEANPNTTDEFFKIPIFDGEEQNFKYTNLPSLSEGLGLKNLRQHKEFFLRDTGNYILPIAQKGETRIVILESCNINNLYIDVDPNTNFNPQEWEGTVLEVISFNQNPIEIWWGKQAQTSTAFQVAASTVNINFGVRVTYILINQLWRKI